MSIATGEQATAADVNALVSNILKTHTRDMTAASGDVAYTGYGFKPKAIIIASTMATVNIMSLGFGDEALSEMALISSPSGGLAGFGADTAKIVVLKQVPATDEQTAVLKTLDADGFTLTWTKTGTPSGTGTLIVLALMA